MKIDWSKSTFFNYIFMCWGKYSLSAVIVGRNVITLITFSPHEVYRKTKISYYSHLVSDRDVSTAHFISQSSGYGFDLLSDTIRKSLL